MANTEHQETLDFLDKLSVCLYRAGISVFAIALLGLAALESQWLDGMDGRYRAVFAVFTMLVQCLRVIFTFTVSQFALSSVGLVG